MWFCFIITVYTFFFIYHKKMEVKHDNMPIGATDCNAQLYSIVQNNVGK